MSNWIKVLLSAAFPFFAFLTIEMLSTGPEAWGNYPIFSKSLFVATLFYMYVIMPAVSFFGVTMTQFDKKNAEYAFFWIFIVAFASVFLTMLTFSTRLLCAAWMFFYPYFIFHFLCFIYNTSPAFLQNVRFIYRSMREIQGHIEEIYATKVSAELISKVTDGVLEEVTAWQNRLLDSTYPIRTILIMTHTLIITERLLYYGR